MAEIKRAGKHKNQPVTGGVCQQEYDVLLEIFVYRAVDHPG